MKMEKTITINLTDEEKVALENARQIIVGIIKMIDSLDFNAFLAADSSYWNYYEIHNIKSFLNCLTESNLLKLEDEDKREEFLK